MHFLLVSLFASDAGLGRVYKSIEIADDISHKLSGEMESLDTFDSMKHSHSKSMFLSSLLIKSLGTIFFLGNKFNLAYTVIFLAMLRNM